MRPAGVDSIGGSFFFNEVFPLRPLLLFIFYRYVTVHTASFWAKSFMKEFRDVCDGQRESTRKLPRLPINEVAAAP